MSTPVSKYMPWKLKLGLNPIHILISFAGSEKIVCWLCRFSILLGFIVSKNQKGLWFYLLIKVQNATSLVFWLDKTQEDRESTESVNNLLISIGSSVLDGFFHWSKFDSKIDIFILGGWFTAKESKIKLISVHHCLKIDPNLKILLSDWNAIPCWIDFKLLIPWRKLTFKELIPLRAQVAFFNYLC